MNFKIRPNNYEVVGVTNRNNEIRYTKTPEENLKFWTPKPITRMFTSLKAPIPIDPDEETYYKAFREATRLQIKCKFVITVQMLDLLESSRILSVEHMTNENENLIIIIPHPLFTYDKLNDILFDMTNKFEL